MNKFVYSALAATLVSTTGFATETEWIELDRELDAMSATLAQDGGGPQMFGWVASNWGFSSDDAYKVDSGGMPSATGESYSGLAFQSVRFGVSGSTADYGYHVSTDLRYGFAMLYQAFGTVNFGQAVTLSMGQFKIPTLRSQLVDQNRTFFIRRSEIFAAIDNDGGELAAVDRGAMISGNYEMVNWALAVQNGEDTVQDKYLLSGRLSFDLMGEGAGQYLEGAYNASDGTNLSLGIFGSDDGTRSMDTARAIGGELYLTSGPFAASAEIISYDLNDGTTPKTDDTPFNLSGYYMFTDQWELGIRWEEMDNTAKDRYITGGVNRYVSGHDVKWMFNWRYSQSDIDALDGANLLSIGLVVSF